LAAPSKVLMEAQKKLAALGYDPGPIDGYMGARTREAVRAFQRARGLAQDGILGPVTMGALMGQAPVPEPVVVRGKRACHTLVWHCTATIEGKEYTRAQIRAMHLVRGFTDIGYHKLIHLDGTVSEGRSEDREGAHVSGHNRGTLGYSYIGGLDLAGRPKDTRTAAQKQTMVRLTKEAIAKYGLVMVLGHRDLSPDRDHDGVVEPFEFVKICPCFNAAPEYGYLLGPRKAKQQQALIVRRKAKTRGTVKRRQRRKQP
jgi:N-acetylmuramoyl-L-alanine amidase